MDVIISRSRRQNQYSIVGAQARSGERRRRIIMPRVRCAQLACRSVETLKKLFSNKLTYGKERRLVYRTALDAGVMDDVVFN
jgi:hypothetical protein